MDENIIIELDKLGGWFKDIVDDNSLGTLQPYNIFYMIDGNGANNYPYVKSYIHSRGTCEQVNNNQAYVIEYILDFAGVRLDTLDLDKFVVNSDIKSELDYIVPSTRKITCSIRDLFYIIKTNGRFGNTKTKVFQSNPENNLINQLKLIRYLQGKIELTLE